MSAPTTKLSHVSPRQRQLTSFITGILVIQHYHDEYNLQQIIVSLSFISYLVVRHAGTFV